MSITYLKLFSNDGYALAVRWLLLWQRMT